MSPADRTAYVEALHGAPGTELRGCAGWASDEVFNLTDELLIEYHLVEPLQAMNGEIAADARVVAARRDWRSCVEPLGFPANDPGPYTVAVLAEFQARTGAVLTQPDHDALLEKLKAEERRVATEVARCGATLSAATNVITSEYEARFVETHRRDLEEVRRRLEYFEQLLPSIPPTPQPASRSETGRPKVNEAPFASPLAYAVWDRPVASPI